MRHVVGAVIGAVLALAVLGPSVASAQAPTLRVHAIFTGGRDTSFHVGEVLDIGVRNAGSRKLTQVCLTPAPVARPACSGSKNAAPSAVGSTTIAVTLSDGTELTRTFKAHAPATKVGGPRAVPATITCQDVTLFGNYNQRRHRSADPIETMRRGAQVGLYNVIAPGKIFMWDYATNRGGFASQSCARTAAS